MMRIDDYHFGSMTVDGKNYGKDLMILSGRIVPGWWRREGHRLDPGDLEEVLKDVPETLVIGTGSYGRMEVPEHTVEHLRALGMTVLPAPTAEAVRLFNERTGRGENVAGAFHLTC